MKTRYIAAFAATLLFATPLRAHAASPEPIVVLVSLHNLDRVYYACEHDVSDAAKNTDYIRQILADPSGYDSDTVKVYSRLAAGASECRSVRDTRELGRRLENQVMNALAVNTRCKGVVAVIAWHEKYDGKLNPVATDIEEHKDHWELLLDYIPGSKVHEWSIYPTAAWNSRRVLDREDVSGEGSAAQIADQVCIVVTGQGATVR